jgi:hypothetical protein
VGAMAVGAMVVVGAGLGRCGRNRGRQLALG